VAAQQQQQQQVAGGGAGLPSLFQMPHSNGGVGSSGVGSSSGTGGLLMGHDPQLQAVEQQVQAQLADMMRTSEDGTAGGAGDHGDMLGLGHLNEDGVPMSPLAHQQHATSAEDLQHEDPPLLLDQPTPAAVGAPEPLLLPPPPLPPPPLLGIPSLQQEQGAGLSQAVGSEAGAAMSSVVDGIAVGTSVVTGKPLVAPDVTPGLVMGVPPGEQLGFPVGEAMGNGNGAVAALPYLPGMGGCGLSAAAPGAPTTTVGENSHSWMT
jgi:hypothetical protein